MSQCPTNLAAFHTPQILAHLLIFSLIITIVGSKTDVVEIQTELPHYYIFFLYHALAYK